MLWLIGQEGEIRMQNKKRRGKRTNETNLFYPRSSADTIFSLPGKSVIRDILRLELIDESSWRVTENLQENNYEFGVQKPSSMVSQGFVESFTSGSTLGPL